MLTKIVVRSWWIIPAASLVFLSAPSFASQTLKGALSPTNTLQLTERELIYQSLQQAREYPEKKRAELRRQIVTAVLNGKKVESNATLLAEILHPQITPTTEVDQTITKVLDLISQAESHADGYDAVQHRAVVLPPKRPTEMSLGEIFAWIEATPKQQHAIGRYQIIPTTLRYLKDHLNLNDHELFDRHLQDKMALQLLHKAGLDEFLDGSVDSETFMDQLAMVWAGLPLRTGLSAYHGVNGNRATMTRDSYETQFKQIFAGLNDALTEGRKN